MSGYIVGPVRAFRVLVLPLEWQLWPMWVDTTKHGGTYRYFYLGPIICEWRFDPPQWSNEDKPKRFSPEFPTISGV